jgi:transposase
VPGASVAAVALAHGVNANLVRKWIEKSRPSTQAEADVSWLAVVPDTPPPATRASTPRGEIEIELPAPVSWCAAGGSGGARAGAGESVPMIRPGPGTCIWLACGFTDMRRGFDGLAALVQSQLEQDPFSGQLFVFRGRKGDRLKLLWWDGDGLCLLAKRLKSGRFIWPQPARVGGPYRRPARDAARRHRLAAPCAHLAAGGGRIGFRGCSPTGVSRTRVMPQPVTLPHRPF